MQFVFGMTFSIYDYQRLTHAQNGTKMSGQLASELETLTDDKSKGQSITMYMHMALKAFIVCHFHFTVFLLEAQMILLCQT